MFFEVRCPGCGRVGACPCARCITSLEPPGPCVIAGARSTHVLFSHDGPGRHFIHAIKFHNYRLVVRWLGEAIAMRVASLDIDIVTWAPTSARRRRERGYDQARLLARSVARRLRVRSASTLNRRGTDHQVGLSRRERLLGPAFVARRRGHGERILVVDDVITTGSTITVAVNTLVKAGFGPVHVAACSRAGRD